MDVRNSTSSGTSSVPNFDVSEISSQPKRVQHAPVTDDSDIVNFDVLEEPPAMTFSCDEDDADSEDEPEDADANEDATEQSEIEESELCHSKTSDNGLYSRDADSIVFELAKKASKLLSKSFKPKGNQNVYVIERGKKTLFVCECGFTSTT